MSLLNLLDPYLTEQVYRTVHEMCTKEVNASLKDFFDGVVVHATRLNKAKIQLQKRQASLTGKKMTKEDKILFRTLERFTRKRYYELCDCGSHVRCWWQRDCVYFL